ncbi:uncharacterized protein CLAFUR5_04721 [Fulvia fulva]|uniref:Uncharacterized protein n=1 Tax=Passalora fulva TaxID=5499 RepID=A0A9Q8LEV4_PASFU|nr:uncharacterized protein CLAFUR5_04721 [Fulvia fulva]UJO16114.1 hypothetical protein CLAFUR5_04721 [Fulvia fulva]
MRQYFNGPGTWGFMIQSEETPASAVNADIGGTGIRVGLYIPVCLALLTLGLGNLHRDDTGAKEIGSAQLLTLFYLNFNAFKAATAGFKELTFPEVIVACMTIDFTAAGLHMTTSSKETLAARWFMGVSALNQIVAVVMIIAMLARIKHNYTDLPGVDIVWWSRINSHSGPSKAVWLYIAARCLILAHGLWLDARYSPLFHRLEKDWSYLAGADQEMERAKEEDETLVGKNAADESEYQYAVLPATVFGKWTEWLPSLLVAVTSTETLAARLRYHSDIQEWGQSAALVLAIAGVMHWAYVMGQVVREKLEQQCFLHWLFDTTRRLKVFDARSRHPVNYPRYAYRCEEGIDISDENLLRTAEANNMTAVRKLLRHDADINAVDQKQGMTTVRYAIRYGNVDFVRELTKKGANLRLPDNLPILLVAAQAGHPNMILYFLHKIEYASKLESREGRSALWSGSRHARRTVTSSIGPWTPDEAGRTPLYAAAEAGQYAAVRPLITHLCPPDQPSPGYSEALRRARSERCDKALRCLIACGTEISYLDNDGSTILHDAVRDCHAQEGSRLVTKAGQVNTTHQNLEDIYRDLECLAKTFKEFTRLVDVSDKDGRTPLSIAVRSDSDMSYNEHATKILLQLGANPFATDSDGKTPLLGYLEWRGQYISRCPRYHQDPVWAHPFVHALCPNLIHPAEPWNESLVAGLLDLPPNVMYWLVHETWIAPESQVGADRRPLIMEAVYTGKIGPVVALLTANPGSSYHAAVDIKQWQFHRAGHEENNYADPISARALESLWEETIEPRQRVVKTIVSGVLMLDWFDSSICILPNPNDHAADEINVVIQHDIYEPPKSIRRMNEDELSQRAEKKYHEIIEHLRDESYHPELLPDGIASRYIKKARVEHRVH